MARSSTEAAVTAPGGCSGGGCLSRRWAAAISVVVALLGCASLTTAHSSGGLFVVQAARRLQGHRSHEAPVAGAEWHESIASGSTSTGMQEEVTLAEPAPPPDPFASKAKAEPSLRTVNTGALIVVASLVVLPGLGHAIEWCCRRCGKAMADDRPRGWVIALLLSSYSLLIPGFVIQLFHVDIGASIMGFDISLMQNGDTMISFIRLLAESGSWLGVLFIICYAVVIPVVKLVLLALGELWRHSDGAPKARWARMCIGTVHSISKWACPDMFAYILLMYLIRGLDHPPTLKGTCQLDLGFTCFSIFCIGSTVASLGIPMPALREEELLETKPSCLAKCIANAQVLQLAVAGLTVVFAVLLGFGITLPCMDLNLDTGLLYEPHGPLPNNDFIKQMIDSLELPMLAHDSVSIWDCIVLLRRWSTREVNLAIAIVMLLLFVLVFTALDMLVLNSAVWGLRSGSSQKDFSQPHKTMATARVLKKLSMLDVLIMGVIVVALSMTVYRKNGVVVNVDWGLLVLAGAELCHYAAYYLVSCASSAATIERSKHAEENAPQPSMEL